MLKILTVMMLRHTQREWDQEHGARARQHARRLGRACSIPLRVQVAVRRDTHSCRFDSGGTRMDLQEGWSDAS